MYRTQLSYLGLIASFLLLATSCRKKEDPIVEPAKREVHINMVNFAGNDSLKLGTATYTNAAGEPFTVSMFNYYISNVKLIAANGTDYVEKESYHLVREGINGSKHFH